MINCLFPNWNDLTYLKLLVITVSLMMILISIRGHSVTNDLVAYLFSEQLNHNEKC